MTRLLYYEDPYLREFSARVADRRLVGGRPAIALDRTAFYPTGGGQPNDTGTLNGIRVLDVQSEEGSVWHVLEEELRDDDVVGVLDWSRRHDHMQQHTGQHILSRAFLDTLGAQTVAFHLGPASSTIDVDHVDLPAESLAAVEAAANAVIDRNLPVSIEIHTAAELQQLDLRRPPKAADNIRVVEVVGYDRSACGGTHVAAAAEIGLIKIIGTERRGAETRVYFLCGCRARVDYGNLQILAEGLTARFTTGRDQLLEAVDRALDESRGMRRELADLENQWAESMATAMWSSAESVGSWRVVCETVDQPVDRAKRLAQALRSRSNVVVLLGVSGEKPQLFFSRAENLDLAMNQVLQRAVTAVGGRGGGRPDWAQGGTPSRETLEDALAAALRDVQGRVWQTR